MKGEKKEEKKSQKVNTEEVKAKFIRLRIGKKQRDVE
jgi:hypothetical protein